MPPPTDSPPVSGTHQHLELAVVGLGNMGGAVLRGLLEAKVLTPDQVGVCDLLPDRIRTFTDIGCREIDPTEVGEAPRMLLAVKPQMFPSVARQIGDRAGRRLAISVMAGLPSRQIVEALGDATAVIRTMPNTPASIGCGVTAISLGPGATPDDLAFVQRIFESVGRVVPVDESDFHAVTAVSGSGPAWLFRMAEAWTAAAISEGLPPATARTLVNETLLGASTLLQNSERGASALREAVTSKGGTTAAGLEALDRSGFDDAIHDAIRAAVVRGRELGQDDQTDQ